MFKSIPIPGKEINLAIAEILGWDHKHDIIENDADCWYSHCRNCGLDMHCGDRDDEPCEWPPDYSGYGKPAWDAGLWLAERGVFGVSNGDGDSWDGYFMPTFPYNEGYGVSELGTARVQGASWPHVICLLILEASGKLETIKEK